MKKVNKVKALIVAAGVGDRMGASLPKQILRLSQDTDSEKTVLDLVLEVYEDNSNIAGITLVYPREYLSETSKIAGKYSKIENLVEGGKIRQESVMFGLNRIESPLTIIHDAARPIVYKSALVECIKKLRAGIRAVHTACRPYATMLLIKNNYVVRTIGRDDIAHGQCPVGYRTEDLKKALEYAISKGKTFRDELSLIRYALPDIKVEVVQGHRSGFKLTYPEDMALLRFYLKEANL